MELKIWLMYVLAMLVLTASPGPSVLLSISKSVSSGMRAALEYCWPPVPEHQMPADGSATCQYRS